MTTDRDAEHHWNQLAGKHGGDIIPDQSYGKPHAGQTTRRYKLTEALGILAELTPRGDTRFADEFVDIYKRLVRLEITYAQAHELVLHLEDAQ